MGVRIWQCVVCFVFVVVLCAASGFQIMEVPSLIRVFQSEALQLTVLFWVFFEAVADRIDVVAVVAFVLVVDVLCATVVASVLVVFCVLVVLRCCCCGCCFHVALLVTSR